MFPFTDALCAIEEKTHAIMRIIMRNVFFIMGLNNEKLRASLN
jgi:hypothetical protein